jgi:hypothetical protein
MGCHVQCTILPRYVLSLTGPGDCDGYTVLRVHFLGLSSVRSGQKVQTRRTLALVVQMNVRWKLHYHLPYKPEYYKEEAIYRG